MKTSLTCPGCHRRYEVDERFAGKTLKCAHCETSMRVPAAEPDAPPEQPAFGEYELGETRASAAHRPFAPREPGAILSLQEAKAAAAARRRKPRDAADVGTAAGSRRRASWRIRPF